MGTYAQLSGSLKDPDHLDARLSDVGHMLRPEYERDWLPVTHFLGLDVSTTWRSVGAGNPNVVEVGSTKIAGLKIDAAGDDIRTLFPVSTKWNCKKDIYASVLWSSDQTTTTDTVTWKMLYDALTIDSSAVAAGTTALDTVIAADANVGVANAIQESPQGIISGGTLTNQKLLSLIVEADAFSGADPSTDVIMLYGVLFYYQRLWL